MIESTPPPHTHPLRQTTGSWTLPWNPCGEALAAKPVPTCSHPPPCGFRNWPQLFRLRSSCLYPLGHPISQTVFKLFYLCHFQVWKQFQIFSAPQAEVYVPGNKASSSKREGWRNNEKHQLVPLPWDDSLHVPQTPARGRLLLCSGSKPGKMIDSCQKRINLPLGVNIFPFHSDQMIPLSPSQEPPWHLGPSSHVKYGPSGKKWHLPQAPSQASGLFLEQLSHSSGTERSERHRSWWCVRNGWASGACGRCTFLRVSRHKLPPDRKLSQVFLPTREQRMSKPTCSELT